MSKPEGQFSFMELERKIKRQMRCLWHAAQENKYDKKKWGELQSDFDWYVSHVKKILKLDKL
jgi:hypothetical protein